MGYILAIDPGNKESAFCLLGPDLRPLRFAKQYNDIAFCSMCDALIEIKDEIVSMDEIPVAIEWIQCFGMPVGDEVIETAAWAGKLEDRFQQTGFHTVRIKRTDEKMAICHSTRANDATIKQALVDRFASGVPNHGKGSKKEPGWFYGFRADIWSAYAVGVTYYEKYVKDRR